MSYNAGGGGYDSTMGGGYGNSPAGSNSYDSKAKGGSSNRRNIDDQSIIPVTCKMILESTDGINGGCTLQDGREPYLVKIVGAVREVVKTSTNYMYTIEDGTGVVQVKEFIDDSSYNEAIQQQREEAAQDHVYIRVIGKATSYEGNKQIIGQSVRKVTGGGNEFTHHLLTVVYSGEKYKKTQTMVGRPEVHTAAGMTNHNSMAPYGQHNSMMSVRTTQGAIGGRNDSLGQELLQFIQVEGGKICLLALFC